jgi:hypothetical protein
MSSEKEPFETCWNGDWFTHTEVSCHARPFFFEGVHFYSEDMQPSGPREGNTCNTWPILASLFTYIKLYIYMIVELYRICQLKLFPARPSPDFSSISVEPCKRCHSVGQCMQEMMLTAWSRKVPWSNWTRYDVVVLTIFIVSIYNMPMVVHVVCRRSNIQWTR